MRGIFAAIRVGLLDMRGDLRRFVLLVVCLAVGTALVAGVGSVGTSIRQAVETNAALVMGGDIELSRADRGATAAELDVLSRYGAIAAIVDTNVRAETQSRSAFVDLVSIDSAYPLLGGVGSPQLGTDDSAYALLSPRDGVFGALLDPLILDRLGISVGDAFELAGTPFQARGLLSDLPDSAVRGFRLGLPALITIEGLATLSDRTSPLPGLGTWFRYKLLLEDRGDIEGSRRSVVSDLGDSGWTVLTARDGLGPMVRFYDLFMRFLVIVGLASLLIGGVSIWSGMSAYIAERAKVIGVLRAMGADRTRLFVHFFSQVAALAAVGVGIGVVLGATIAALALPIVGRSVGIDLAPALHLQPLLVAASAGLVTAFAFAYLPLQQAQTINPVVLFRSKGMALPPIEWRALLASPRVIPLLLAIAAFTVLAIAMTGDPVLVAAFALAIALLAGLFQLAIAAALHLLRGLQETRLRPLRYALRALSAPGSSSAAVVVSVGLPLAMLIVVLVLQVNLRNEYLGASIFDAPTMVASDLFGDEVAMLETMRDAGGDIVGFTATPMLRGQLTSINDVSAQSTTATGPAAQFLLSGDVPLTYRTTLPATSLLVEGEWWPDNYAGPPLVSLHQSLRSGLGVDLGDRLAFTIFGEEIVAEIANFRDYSWQGGIDFLVAFSPGVLEFYPSTLLGAVTAARGREEAVERELATAMPDVKFIAIGATLERITTALGQLSLAASIVGGVAVFNGLLVLMGSLSTGRRQREADAVITKVLGATRFEVVAVSILQYALLAIFAALIATPLGIAFAWVLTALLLEVGFTLDAQVLTAVDIGAILATGVLGATTILGALSVRPARLLRELGAE